MKQDLQPEPFGDRGIILRSSQRVSRRLTAKLAGVSLAARALDGVIDAAPGHRTVLLEIDAAKRQLVLAAVHDLIAHPPPVQGQEHAVGATYDGPDLSWALAFLKISRDEFIKVHSSKTYDVKMIGSPTFIYLSSVSTRLTMPRLEQPRLSVPEGSIGIGGRQAGIYGKARPGGWRLIGRIDRVPQALPGDRIRFIPQ